MLIVSAFCFGGQADKGSKCMAQVNGRFLFPSDGNYKDVYGSSVFYFGVRAGYRMAGNIYLWLGYDYVKKTGTTRVLEEEARSTQHFIGLGAGYRGDFSEKFGYRLQAVILFISYKEEALGETVSDSALGFDLEWNLVYYLIKRIYGLLALGYAYGSDDVDGVGIELGGAGPESHWASGA